MDGDQTTARKHIYNMDGDQTNSTPFEIEDMSGLD